MGALPYDVVGALSRNRANHIQTGGILSIKISGIVPNVRSSTGYISVGS